MVQAITLNHLILQHHIDGLEKRTGKMQLLVIALTIASLIGTGVQCWLAYKADERSNMESKTELIQNPVQNTSGISKKSPVAVPSN